MTTSRSSGNAEGAAGTELATALFVEAARHYSKLGWALIRCDGKTPRGKEWEKTQPDEPNLAAGKWSDWGKRYNMGVVLGPSGLAVFEYDRNDARERFWNLLGRELPATPICRTGSGKLHVYFATPETLKKGQRDGLELRVGPHQCLAPPSLHPDTGVRYEWLSGHEPWAVPCLTLPADIVTYFATDSKRRRNGADQVAEVLPSGNRHYPLIRLAGTMRAKGMDGEEILAALRVVNERRCRPPLEDEWLENIAHDVADRYPPDPERAMRVVPEATAQPIDGVLKVFRKWLHLPDPALLYSVCAATVANRVEDFDPTWLICVGPAGSGKSETLAATSQLGDVHVVGTLTEAALLSGTPRKDTASGASGGLLREVGERGIIVLKDFGSILSMHREARAAVLAALREVYDGSWTRLVGADGGRRLHWEGRLGLLAGATSVLDQHHGVMAQLGERFLLYRVDVPDAAAQARKSLAHHGRERVMRRELSEAVAGLFAGLDLSELPPLKHDDKERLIALAMLVARARSPVVRDAYRREVELVPDSEAPGRIVGVLGRFLTGLRLIGVSEDEAWRVTVKTGLDSMPAARRHAFEFLLDSGEKTTTDVATSLGLPNPTTHRTLEELAAHGVLVRKSQGQGKADLWRVEPWARKKYREATSSETSVGDSSNESENTNDDISEEVSS